MSIKQHNKIMTIYKNLGQITLLFFLYKINNGIINIVNHSNESRDRRNEYNNIQYMSA